MKKFITITAAALLVAAPISGFTCSAVFANRKVAGPAEQLPFDLNRSAFLNYWRNNAGNLTINGSNAKLEKAGFNCYYVKLLNKYMCKESFVTISDPRGSRVCSAIITYQGAWKDYRSNQVHSDRRGFWISNLSGCRWHKDPRFAD